MIEQMPVADWPEWLGVEVLMVALGAADIASRTGVTFERSYDSLDIFDGAVVQVEGVWLGLIDHFRGPGVGTVVVAPDLEHLGGLSAEDAAQALLERLGIDQSEVIWRRSR